jgi:hypothetical protein
VFSAPHVAIPDEPLDLPDAFAATEPMDFDVGFETSRALLTLIFLIVDMIICSVRDSEPSPPSVAQTAGPSGNPEADMFTVVYHHNSGRASETQPPEGHSKKPNPPRNLGPWKPFFKSREDFEIAEVLMKVGAREADCNRILKAFRRCLDGKGSLNLNKYSDVRHAWERASAQLTPVSSQLGEVSLLTGSGLV